MNHKREKKIYFFGSLLLAAIAALAIYSFLLLSGLLGAANDTLVIRSASAEKIYDGTPLEAPEWEISFGSLREGHSVKATVSGELTRPGEAENQIELAIYNAKGENVTDTYRIWILPGVLRVTKRELVLYSESAEKYYDGKALKKNRWGIASGTLALGDILSVGTFGAQTEVGKSENFLSAVITAKNGETDVSDCYQISYLPGTLEVLENTGNSSSNNRPGSTLSPIREGNGSTTAGGMSSSMSTSGPGAPVSSEPIFTVASSKTSGLVYFRYRSLGNDLLKNSDGEYVWQEVDQPPNHLEFDPLPVYFSLSGYPATWFTIGFSSPAKSNPMLQPAHTIEYSSAIQSTDRASYTVNSAPFLFRPTAENIAKAIQDFQDPYYLSDTERQKIQIMEEYARKSYLSISAERKAALLAIGKQNGLSPNDGEIYQKIADYVKGALTYDLNFPPIPEEVEDPILYLLQEGKRGVCNNYAAVAVYLYRAYGIPARVCIGYLADTVYNETVTVTSDRAHAWVEIFISSLGWVQIEVTGSSDSGGSGQVGVIASVGENALEGGKVLIDPGLSPALLRGTLRFSTGSKKKDYDGTPLTAPELEVFSALASGDWVDFTASRAIGSITEDGSVENAAYLLVRDQDGNDVTSYYRIEGTTGTLSIQFTGTYIPIKTRSAAKLYDGKPLVATDLLEYDKRLLKSGHQIVPSSIAWPSLTDAGEILNLPTVIIRDIYGRDVSAQYRFTTEECGILRVEKRKLFVKTGSAEQIYNGRPLSCSAYTVETELAEYQSLVSGHKLSVTGLTRQKNVGTVSNVLSFTVLDRNGENRSRNYAIYQSCGTLCVTPAQLEITTDSYEGKVDGTDHTAPGYSYRLLIGEKEYLGRSASGPEIVLTDSTGDLLTVTVTGSRNTAGKSPNMISEIRITDSDGNDVTRNYNITYHLGTIRLVP